MRDVDGRVVQGAPQRYTGADGVHVIRQAQRGSRAATRHPGGEWGRGVPEPSGACRPVLAQPRACTAPQRPPTAATRVPNLAPALGPHDTTDVGGSALAELQPFSCRLRPVVERSDGKGELVIERLGLGGNDSHVIGELQQPALDESQCRLHGGRAWQNECVGKIRRGRRARGRGEGEGMAGQKDEGERARGREDERMALTWT